MKKLILLFFAIHAATSAFGVVNPDPDLIGIYFDLSADENCRNIGPSIPFNAYLILTNTTAPSIGGYEVGYQNLVPTGMEGMIFRLSSTIANGVVEGIDLGDSSDILNGDHIVGLASPLASSVATILHTWQFMLLSPAITVDMYISSCSQSSIPGPFPVILNADTNELFIAGQSSGQADWPVACVNTFDCCPTSVEEYHFGSVKALYR